jgi:hypothetical protein
MTGTAARVARSMARAGGVHAARRRWSPRFSGGGGARRSARPESFRRPAEKTRPRRRGCSEWRNRSPRLLSPCRPLGHLVPLPSGATRFSMSKAHPSHSENGATRRWRRSSFTTRLASRGRSASVAVLPQHRDALGSPLDERMLAAQDARGVAAVASGGVAGEGRGAVAGRRRQRAEGSRASPRAASSMRSSRRCRPSPVRTSTHRTSVACRSMTTPVTFTVRSPGLPSERR